MALVSNLNHVRPKAGKLSSLWQAAAILLPLILLAVLGLRGLEASRQGALEEASRQAERAFTQAAPALKEWTANWIGGPTLDLYPIPPIPAPPSDAQALYAEALRLSGTSQAQAVADLAVLETKYPDALAPSGIPLLPLVELLWMRLAANPNAVLTHAAELSDAAVQTHPSMLTPDLIASGQSLLKERGIRDTTFSFSSAWQRWNDNEAARAAFRQNRDEIDAARQPFWIGSEWWVQPRGQGENPRIMSYKLMQEEAWPIAATLRQFLPDYEAPSISLDGIQLTGRSGSVLFHSQVEQLDIDIVLAFPDRLLAQQRQQTLWFAGLLASALAAVLAGFIAMRRALMRERQLGQLKSDFVSSVSHELRAPIASMRLMAENLESGAVAPESRRGEYFHLIAEECRRLSALIDNVLDFARIEQNRKSYDFLETDVAALVRDAVDFMQPRAAQRRQQIVADLQPIDPPPVCDGLAIRQALINLLDNAIKFSPEGGAIHVQLGPHDSATWKIAVRDEGPGIPAAEHEAIFERFHRLGSELRRETQGAGIGLNIVRHIAQAHHGTVKLNSRPGSGSEFTLLLPISPNPA
jgi:signal transduction histidine kinase